MRAHGQPPVNVLCAVWCVLSSTTSCRARAYTHLHLLAKHPRRQLALGVSQSRHHLVPLTHSVVVEGVTRVELRSSDLGHPHKCLRREGHVGDAGNVCEHGYVLHGRGSCTRCQRLASAGNTAHARPAPSRSCARSARGSRRQVPRGWLARWQELQQRRTHHLCALAFVSSNANACSANATPLSVSASSCCFTAADA